MMKKQFKEAEVEVTKFTVFDNVATNFVSNIGEYPDPFGDGGSTVLPEF